MKNNTMFYTMILIYGIITLLNILEFWTGIHIPKLSPSIVNGISAAALLFSIAEAIKSWFIHGKESETEDILDNKKNSILALEWICDKLNVLGFLLIIIIPLLFSGNSILASDRFGTICTTGSITVFFLGAAGVEHHKSEKLKKEILERTNNREDSLN